jgi:hypothetical protein
MSKPGDACPFMLGEPCIEHKCKLYRQILGTNPQTGQEIDEWDCVMALGLIASLELNKQTLGVHAAINSFRNEVVEQNNSFAAIFGAIPSSQIEDKLNPPIKK